MDQTTISRPFPSRYEVEPTDDAPVTYPWQPEYQPIYEPDGSLASMDTSSVLRCWWPASDDLLMLEAGPWHAWTCPNPDQLLLCDREEALLVDVRLPPSCRRLVGREPWSHLHVQPLVEAGLVLLLGTGVIAALDGQGVRWSQAVSGIDYEWDARRRSVVLLSWEALPFATIDPVTGALTYLNREPPQRPTSWLARLLGLR